MARRSTKQRKAARRRKLAQAAWAPAWIDEGYMTLLHHVKDLQANGTIR